MKKPNITAIIMAAGSGTRMKTATSVKKQFADLCGMPVVVYSLKAFEENENITSIVLVVPEDSVDEALGLCMKYNIRKVKNITGGSDQRFKSVFNGLKAAPADTDYVLIHDGVRPMITEELINRVCKYVMLTRACVAAVPVTDTIKRANVHGFAAETLDRSALWSIQTPQAFSYPLLLNAYKSLYKTIEDYNADTSKITDDAVIVENMTDCKVRLVLGDPSNIKITTPNDMIVAKAYITARKEKEDEETNDHEGN